METTTLTPNAILNDVRTPSDSLTVNAAGELLIEGCAAPGAVLSVRAITASEGPRGPGDPHAETAALSAMAATMTPRPITSRPEPLIRHCDALRPTCCAARPRLSLAPLRPAPA